MDRAAIQTGDVKGMQPLALAFLGDAVYEIYIRRYVIEKGFRTVSAMHRETIKFVKAKSQCEAVKKLLPLLTEEEAAVVRRGRNANPHTVPKNADMADYRYATALESLFGYLYLMGSSQRLEALMKAAVEIIEEEYRNLYDRPAKQ